MSKKHITITGALAAPVVPGLPAYIQEAVGLRRTSAVVHIEQTSSAEIRFETVNTLYRLLLQQPLSKTEVTK